MSNDPRAGETATRYIRILQDLQTLGHAGFAVMLDTASAEEITALLEAATTIQASIDRTRRIL